MKTEIFLNLPVKDLNRSMAFFTELGFTFNLNFTDDKAACLEIGENIFAMLLLEEFFKTFTQKQICNTATTTEILMALSVDSREKVDEIITAVVKAGGTEYMEAKDYGWMYQKAFLDLDGHHWEIFFMDESQAPKN
ncbi:glyoxalase/bleomycin resistance/extradiol dioxygenase family protein [Flavobacterium sp. LS1R47]|jgi:predicted lactoylglutathione lyase|uniref:Glyoxalase/bleomycin resistance/extradiol dioxygenase family protein n=1 Tax=Flavobacterium frigoritolerans TaxID=2987686 RepID=A0A9X2ZNI6_9FLAO|nr:VOC family protein [Flavobacterium frigoritolerans]MCV9932700.1 glyoxalase/bleomycin resistance/extradiol dioxygenase family protein [Flavobacterium frigoritolerans]